MSKEMEAISHTDATIKQVYDCSSSIISGSYIDWNRNMLSQDLPLEKTNDFPVHTVCSDQNDSGNTQFQKNYVQPHKSVTLADCSGDSISLMMNEPVLIDASQMDENEKINFQTTDVNTMISTEEIKREKSSGDYALSNGAQSHESIHTISSINCDTNFEETNDLILPDRPSERTNLDAEDMNDVDSDEFSIPEDFQLDDSMDEGDLNESEINDYYMNEESNDDSNENINQALNSAEISESDDKSTTHGTDENNQEISTGEVKRKGKRVPKYKRNMVKPADHNFTDLTKLEPGNNECLVCKKTFKLRNKLLAHFSIHPPENPHLFDLSRKTSSLVNVKVVPPTPEEIKEKPFVCALCPKRFRKYGGLEAHCCVHTGEKPYVCNVCSKAYRDKQYLVGHAMLHTGNVKHVCDLCKKVFTRRQNLETHYLTHTGEKPFVCDVCSQSFRKKNLLVIHYRIHTNEFPFSCKECGRGFRSKRYLVNHAMTHSGEKPHVCELCGKKFAHKSWLLKHHDLHTGKRPHECIQCHKNFARRVDLEFHLRIHTGERPFVCTICQKGFIRNSFLKIHLRTHFEDETKKAQRREARRRKRLNDLAVAAEANSSEDAPKSSKEFEKGILLNSLPEKNNTEIGNNVPKRDCSLLRSMLESR